MGNLVKASTGLPTISRALSDAINERVESRHFGPPESPEDRVARAKRGDPARGMVIRLAPHSPSNVAVSEAKRILPQLEAAMRPADRETVLKCSARIIRKLNGAIANPLADRAVAARVGIFAEAAQDLPAGVWDEGIDRKVVKLFKFMPSVSELVEILEAEIQPLRDKIARVRVISQFQPKPVEKIEKPSAEEVERRRKILAELRGNADVQEQEDREIREFGMWMPEGAEDLSGLELAAALRSHLRNMDGPKKRITERRIEALERNASVVAQLERMMK